MVLFNLSQTKTDHTKVELSGSNIIVYHRTGTTDVAENICDIGFIAGSGAAYGVGIYSTYNLDSSLNNYNLGYGGMVVKAQVDLSGFVIFDYDIAKQVYGGNYRIQDQVENVIGFGNFFSVDVNDPKDVQSKRDLLLEYDKRLEKGGYTSDVAFPMTSRYRGSSDAINFSQVRGILFTGRRDGKVVVSYRQIAVYPMAHAFIDGRTNINKIKWLDCPARSQEEYDDLVKDEAIMESTLDERSKLLQNLSTIQEGSPIDIPKFKYPKLPDKIFDQIIASYIYKDDERINHLSPELQTRLKDIIEVDFLIRKLKNEPSLYWNEYLEVDKSVKDKISQDMLVTIWEDYLDKHPGRWDDVPIDVVNKIEQNGEVIEEITMRDLVSKRSEIKYWNKVVRKNKDNAKYVPEDILAEMRVDSSLTDARVDVAQDLNETAEFDVHISSVDWVYGEVEKMNKRAAKLGLPPLKVEVLGENRRNGTKKMKIVGNVPLLQGFRIVAKMMPYETEDGDSLNMIENLSGDLIPPEYVDAKLGCDHCRHNRKRNIVYLLYNENEGQYKTIGSTCLGDFFEDKSGNPLKVAAYAEKLAQMLVRFKEGNQYANNTEEQVRKSFAKQGVPLQFFLGKVLLAEKITGDFISFKQGRASGKETTAGLAWGMSTDSTLDEKMVKQAELTPADLTFIDNAIEWISNIPKPAPESGELFHWNLHVACEPGIVTRKTSSMVSWALVAYRKQIVDEEIDYHELLGEVGEQVFFKGKVIVKKPIFFRLQKGDDDKTINQIYMVAQSEDGKLVIWTHEDEKELEIDNDISIRAIVSGHTKYENNSATSLSNVQFIDDNEFEQNKNAMEIQWQLFVDKHKNEQATDTQSSPIGSKPNYGNGNKIETDFTIQDIRQGQTGQRQWILYRLVDAWGINVGAFIDGHYNKGDVIKVRGTVQVHHKWGITIQNAEVVKDNAKVDEVDKKQVQPATIYQLNDIVNEDMTVVFVSSTEARYGGFYHVFQSDGGQNFIAYLKFDTDDIRPNRGDRVKVEGKAFKEIDYKGEIQFQLRAPKVTLATAQGPIVILGDRFNLWDRTRDQKEKMYTDFQNAYQGNTGTAWDQGKFRSRAGNWTFYGDEGGYVAVREQRSGLLKLVGMAGSPKSILKGFDELMAENKPIWGLVSDDIAGMAEKRGLKVLKGKKAAALLKIVMGKIPSGVMGGAQLQGVQWDAGIKLEYNDVGETTKYFVGNNQYFNWLMSNPDMPVPAKFILKSLL